MTETDTTGCPWLKCICVCLQAHAFVCFCGHVFACVACVCVCLHIYVHMYVHLLLLCMVFMCTHVCACLCVCALERTVVTFNLLRSNILNYFYIFTPLPFCVCMFATVHMWRSVLSFLHTGLGSELRSSSWAAGASIQRSISPACMLFNLFISLWFFSLVLGIESHHWPSPLILDYMFISENL